MYKLAMRIRERQLQILIAIKVYCKRQREIIRFWAVGEWKYLSWVLGNISLIVEYINSLNIFLAE